MGNSMGQMAGFYQIARGKKRDEGVGTNGLKQA